MNTVTVNRAVMRKHIETLTNLYVEGEGRSNQVQEVIQWLESLMGRSKDDEQCYVLLTQGDDWQVQVMGPFNLEDAKSCHSQQDPDVYCRSVVRPVHMPTKDVYDPNLRSNK